MGILNSFKGEPKKAEHRVRRAKHIYGEGSPERRAKKQSLGARPLLNPTTFSIIVKTFSALLIIALIAFIGWVIFIGVNIFIP